MKKNKKKTVSISGFEVAPLASSIKSLPCVYPIIVTNQKKWKTTFSRKKFAAAS